MNRLDPGTVHVPSVKLAHWQIEHVIDDAMTCLLLHHGTFPWHDRVAPGFDFFVWTTRRTKRGMDRVAARVRTLHVCVHPDVRSLRDCPAGHRPDQIQPGKQGWRRICDAAVRLGETGRLDPGRWREKFGEPWSVIDFEFVGTLNREVPRRRRYRNQVEVELAEQSRALEAARLAAETVGPAVELSDEERRHRAKSAAYNRKLSKALDTGAGTATLTVTEADIEAELPRIRH